MTTKEIAKQIREELKNKFSYNSKKVSVRSGGSINITIKDAKIRIDELEYLKTKFEKISYCESSGEILSGGNTFVFIEYCDKLEEELTKKSLPIIKALFASLDYNSEKIIDGLKIIKVDNYYPIIEDLETGERNQGTIHSIAFRHAQKILK